MRQKIAKWLTIGLMVLAIGLMILGAFTSCTGALTSYTSQESKSGEIYTYHQGSQIPFRVSKQEFEGHIYILFTGTNRLGVVHDPNCPCHQNIDCYAR